MPAAVVEIAEAVKDALNAAGLSQPFEAVRAYVPPYDLTELTTLRVVVMAAELSLEPLSRNSDDFTYAVDVAVLKVIGRGLMTPGEVRDATDPLMLLVQEIMDLFRGRTLAGYPVASSTAVANDPIYRPDALDDRKVFASLVRLTFKAVRFR